MHVHLRPEIKFWCNILPVTNWLLLVFERLLRLPCRWINLNIHIIKDILQSEQPVLTAPKRITCFLHAFYSHGILPLQIRIQVSWFCNAAFPSLDIWFVFHSSWQTSSFLLSLRKSSQIPESSVAYSYLSDDAVSRRMWVKPIAIH